MERPTGDAGDEDEPYAVLPHPPPRWVRRCFRAYNAVEISIVAAVALSIVVSILVGVIDWFVGLR